MKHLIVTYHLHRPGEDAESSIRLPMLPEHAATVMEGNSFPALDALLDCLADMQGYDSAEFFAVEESD